MKMKSRMFPAATVLAAALAFPGSAQAELLEAPLNTALPVLSGTPEVGQTLGVDAGTWLYAEGGPTYQWKRCNSDGAQCSGVAGATSSTFLLTAEDALSTVMVTVTMSNLFGSTDADTQPSPVVRASTPPADDNDDATLNPESTTSDGGTTGTPTGAGTTVAGKCLKLVSGRRTKKVRRVGRLRMAVAADRCITKSAPLRVSFRAAKGKKLRSVKYRLGSNRLRTAKARRYKVAFRPSKIGAGRQRLTVRVTPRRGKTKTVKLTVRFAIS